MHEQYISTHVTGSCVLQMTLQQAMAPLATKERKSMLFKIPVHPDNYRVVKNPEPQDPDELERSVEESKSEVRIVHAYVNVNDLPDDIPIDPDPRRPKSAGEVPKRIKSSLLLNDGKFHLKNRGITISAKHCDYDNKRKLLTLNLPDSDDQFGILDGAHTYECINQGVVEKRTDLGLNPDRKLEPARGQVLPAQFVHLEILERIEQDLADIAEARNFSLALKPWTLANYRDKFEWLLEALGKDYAAKIRVSENDLQPVGILDVIQLLSAVNRHVFPVEKPALEAYKNVGKMLQVFVADGDRYRYQALAPVARDILRLHDHVRFHFKEKYNAPDESGKRGKFGRTKEAKEAKEKRGSRSKATYHFLEPGKEPVYGAEPIDKGFSIPLISGFRVLLLEKEGVMQWETDPFTFFDTYGTKLVRTVMGASEANDGDPHVVGRDAQIYQRLTEGVRLWYLEKRLADKNF